MKNIFFIFLFIGFFGFGQEMPNIIPPSPSPFQMTKYGEIPIKERNGFVNASIPIMTYEVGDLKLPIFLSYNAAGVEVDAIAGWTGINWNLNAGGVITRVVRDKPDEDGDRMIFNSFSDLSNLNASQINALEYIDTEVDIFTFSFLNFSGGFYIDENLNPVLTNYNKELSIKIYQNDFINNDTPIFIITDTSGVKYYFGGSACEQTRLVNPSAQGSNEITATTSFYLFKIENRKGDIINFNYDTTSSNTIILSLGERISKEITLAGTESYFNWQNQLNTYNGKTLKKITNSLNDIEIEFNTSTNINNNILKKLSDIKVESIEYPNLNKTINLDYYMAPTRFFLKEVNLGNDKIYTLEYDDLYALPQRLSKAQDYLGYYNGKDNNSTLLPKNNNSLFQSVSGFNSLADREPVFDKSIKGTLTKIIYPTKGWTNFTYESPILKDQHFTRKFLHVYSHITSYASSTDLEDIAYTGELTTDPEIPNSLIIIGAHEDTNINVIIDVDSNNIPSCGKITHHTYIVITVVDQVTDIERMNFFRLDHWNDNNNHSYHRQFSFPFLKDHYYKVTMRLTRDGHLNTPNIDTYNDDVIPFSYVNATAYFDYNGAEFLTNGVGVRVDEVVDNPIDKEPLLKKYYYSSIDLDNLKINKKVLYGLSSAFITTTSNYECDGWGAGIIKDYLVLNTNSLGRFFSAKVINPNPYLTISFGGGNFEKGGVEKKFLNRPSGSVLSYFPSSPVPYMYDAVRYENQDIFNSRPEYERYFAKKNGNLYLVKEINYLYDINLSTNINNIFFKRLFTPCLYQDNTIEGIYLGKYKTYSFKLSEKSKIIDDYIDYVPLEDIQNKDNYNKIERRTMFTYDVHQGIPSEILTYLSNGESKKIKYYYPPKLNNIISSFSKPIMVEMFVNSEKKSTIKNSYSNFSGLWESLANIKTSKGNGVLKTKIIYHRYDTLGNPLELSKADSTHICYIWGYYKTQPIAKIVGATYTEIENILGTDFSIDKYFTTTQERSLRNGLPNAQITTLDYYPLIGLKTVTDPKGDTQKYFYDNFNRLQYVKDKFDNILSENEYHYRP